MTNTSEMDTQQNELIHVDTKLPPLKNNEKCVTAIKEFIGNKSLQRLHIESIQPLLTTSMFEILEKTAKFSVFRADASLMENVTDCLRKSIQLSIRSVKDVYEGEISNIKIVKDESGNPQWIDVSLRTAKATKQVFLSRYLINVISNINIGDVVYIEPNSGIVKRLGRSETHTDEYDLEGDKYVQLSKAAVHSTKEKQLTLSVYDFDYAFNKYSEPVSIFSRKHVDDMIEEYISTGTAQLVDSCVFIEHPEYLSRADLSEIVYLTERFPSLKVVTAGLITEGIQDTFLKITVNINENAVDLIEHIVKKKIDTRLREAVLEVASLENYTMIVNLLGLVNTSEEFISLYNQQ